MGKVVQVHGKSSPGNIRRIPIKIEQIESLKVCKKNNVDIAEFETKQNHPQHSEQVSHLKTGWSEPESNKVLNNISMAKPPQGKQNVQIQRDISRESGGRNQKIAQQESDKYGQLLAQQESDKYGQLLREKKEVDFDQIHTQLEDAKVKLEVQMKKLQCRDPVQKIEQRSRSVGSEHRNLGARPKNSHTRYSFQRERSMEDIDKDIKTIWKELQDLDNLPKIKDRRPKITERPEQPAPPLLSEQELVIPSWRTPTPPSSKKVTVANNVQKSFYNSVTPRPRPVSSSSPRTIWDSPETVENRSNSSLSQYKTIPTPSTHFSFLPKADTKPGSITPIIVNVSTRTSRSAIKEKRSNKEPSEVSSLKPERSKSMPKQNTEWPQCYNSFNKIQGQNVTGVTQKESTPLKSCLKSDSRSNSLGRTSKIGSNSPSTRESPATQNVIFKQEASKHKFDAENEASKIEGPYEFIDVKINK